MNTRQIFHSLRWYGLVVCVMISIFLCSSCGTPPTDHPLPLNSDTSTDQGSATAVATEAGSITPIKVISSQTNISSYPGGPVTLTISTSPYALCIVTVEYGLGKPSMSSGLVPITADPHGIASWQWRVERNAHTGTWPLTISAILANGAKTSTQINVNVTPAPISVVSTQTNLSAYPGGSMNLVIATAPHVNCNISLTLHPGESNTSLGASSDSNGFAGWTWKVPRNESPGVYPLGVTVTMADGERSYASLNMTVL